MGNLFSYFCFQPYSCKIVYHSSCSFVCFTQPCLKIEHGDILLYLFQRSLLNQDIRLFLQYPITSRKEGKLCKMQCFRTKRTSFSLFLSLVYIFYKLKLIMREINKLIFLEQRKANFHNC